MTRRHFLKSLATGLGGIWLGGLADRAAWTDAEVPDMILIPAGPFLMGTTPEQAGELAREYGFHVSWLAGEAPQRRVELPAFRIDRLPVTNSDFAAFCRAAGHAPRAHWPGGRVPPGLADHPVVGVNKADAEAYAQWAGKRLPTEAEWEKAARGPDGLLFPWGNGFDPDACQWNRDRGANGPGTAPVTAHAPGASPYGVLDMTGNAAEWCADSPGPGSGFIKGGGWLTETPLNLRPAARNMSGFANNAANFYGFRCARDA